MALDGDLGRTPLRSPSWEGDLRGRVTSASPSWEGDLRGRVTSASPSWEGDLRGRVTQWLTQEPEATLVVHDFDADGLSAAALLHQAHPLTRPLAPPNRQNWPEFPSEARRLMLLDLAWPEDAPWTLPTLVIDHHPLSHGELGAWLAIHPSLQNWPQPTCTALMAYQIFGGPAWIAAVGAFSDLGERAPVPILQDALQVWGASCLSKVTSLVNSVHRCEGDLSQVLRALKLHQDPQDFLKSRNSSVAYLRDCRKKVRQSLNQACAARPWFSGALAVVEFESDCPIQGLLAQMWKDRLPEHLVLAANLRAQRDLVQISVRCRGSRDAVQELRERGLIVHGHPRSAGTALTREQWDRLREAWSQQGP